MRDLSDDNCGVVVWCSARGKEKAQIDQDAKHGLFTLAFLKALEDKEGANRDKYDGRVYLHHIQSFVFEEVHEKSGKRQHPILNLPGSITDFPLRQPPMISKSAGG